MTGRVAALVVLAVLGTPGDATGQSEVGLNGYGVLGDMRLDAAQTFKAVSETSHGRLLGAGIQVTNIWRSLFVEVAVSSMTIDGERVFIDEERAAQPLGIPLEVSMRYVDVAAGWRTRHGRLSPYAGGGFSALRYRERSEFAQPGEDVAEGGTGPLVLAGVDFTLSRWVRIGAELRYRRISGVLGSGGASAEFHEDSAGGVSTALRVSIGR
jgi:opacity protein-like surface antigen